jgi:hypothetical protein
MGDRRVSRRSVESFGTIAILKGNLAPRQVPFFRIYGPWVQFGSSSYFYPTIDPTLQYVKWWMHHEPIPRYRFQRQSLDVVWLSGTVWIIKVL